MLNPEVVTADLAHLATPVYLSATMVSRRRLGGRQGKAAAVHSVSDTRRVTSRRLLNCARLSGISTHWRMLGSTFTLCSSVRAS